MKKILSVLLALVLCLSLCGMAFATSVGSEQGDVVINVQNSAVEDSSVVYQVEFKWDSLIFTYDFGGGTIKWDTEEHDYVLTGAGTAGWVDNKTTANITVINHSNGSVKVTALLDNGSASKTANGVTATLSNNEYTIGSAVGTAYNAAPSGITQVKITNAPNTEEGFTLGKITVSVTHGN